MEEKKPEVYIEQAENLTKDGVEAIKKITDIEKKPKRKQLPINFMVDEFMDQQLTTLQDKSDPKKPSKVSSDLHDNKINLGENKNANDANANGWTSS